MEQTQNLRDVIVVVFTFLTDSTNETHHGCTACGKGLRWSKVMNDDTCNDSFPFL